MNVKDVCPGCLEEGVDPPGILTRNLRPGGGNGLSGPKTLTCTKLENPHSYPDDPEETNTKS